MKHIFVVIGFILQAGLAQAQGTDKAPNIEIALGREQVRKYFGTYEFTPRFQMRVFSENTKLYAQRIGDEEKMQIFPKQANVFFLKSMPAELEFLPGTGGNYDVLVLHQGGKDLKAQRTHSQPYELYDTVLALDSLLYQAYNSRDLDAFMVYFAPDLEFYHDVTGFTTYTDNLNRFKTNFTRPTVMRRVLLKNSLEVYPINGFGAIEVGTHQFYQTDPGKPERLVSEPKFMHVWQNTNGKWKIVRIVSYDH